MEKKIAFGTSLLDKGLAGSGIDGIGHYCQELLHQFSEHKQEIELVPYSFGVKTSLSNAQILGKYSSQLRSLIGSGLNPASEHFFQGVDLVHSTDQLIPILRNKPLVATVMDTIPLSHPAFIRFRSRFLKPYLWKKLTQRADHLITISDFSKNQIVNLMDYPAEKITSIPLGVDERYFQKISEEKIKKTLKHFQIDKSFFLFIGSIQPRKNLLRLLQAHASLPSDFAKEFPLVIAGKLAWDDGQILRAINEGIVNKRCIWVHYVDDDQKRSLLQACFGMSFVSLYEGFGLPIIEAFASEAPVITSNCTSMPEVAGDCALLVDPLSLESIRNALLKLIEDRSIVSELRVNGLQRAKQFTWSRVSEQTKNVYELFI
jgi:alpha-1,3-rhamnosyl/mannosyltransferase